MDGTGTRQGHRDVWVILDNEGNFYPGGGKRKIRAYITENKARAMAKEAGMSNYQVVQYKAQ